MKIKILKDIPGLDASASIEISADGSQIVVGNHTFNVNSLLRDGWAEEVKDEIDVIEIRRNTFNNGPMRYINLEAEDFEWHKSYEIVKAVILKLSDEKLSDINEDNSYHYEILWSNKSRVFIYEQGSYAKYSIFPKILKKEIAEKVIELCGPELKLLFNVKE